MAIRGDSWSSTAEVKAFVPHLVNSTGTFSPVSLTVTQVEKFIDRVSAVLNAALWHAGLNPASVKVNSTASLSCDDFVTTRAVAYCELTQRGEGFSAEEGSRYGAFMNLTGLEKDATKFVGLYALGFKRMGVSVANPVSQGLAFTGQSARADRADPDDTSLEQPFISRHQFDDISISEDESN